MNGTMKSKESEIKGELNEQYRVSLKCGRSTYSKANNAAGDYCGNCETNTNNHTPATCC